MEGENSKEGVTITETMCTDVLRIYMYVSYLYILVFVLRIWIRLLREKRKQGPVNKLSERSHAKERWR